MTPWKIWGNTGGTREPRENPQEHGHQHTSNICSTFRKYLKVAQPTQPGEFLEY
jgi:hypothetical protein